MWTMGQHYTDFPSEYLFTEPQTTNFMNWGMKVPGPGGKIVDATGSMKLQYHILP